MIPKNTVFNPTVNGPLHFGHAYMMLVNEAAAHTAGGRFIIRFDDTQEYWADRMSWNDQNKFKLSVQEDCAWLGINVDGFFSQSEMSIEGDKRLATFCQRAGIPVPIDHYVDDHVPDVPRDQFAHYPFTAFKTAQKVVFDDMLGINLKIRGEDLLGEFALYSYFREAFGMFQPRQVFLPRLHFSLAGDTGDISKTDANMQIGQLRRAGLLPETALKALRGACLKDIEGPWSIDNLQPAPRLYVSKEVQDASQQ